MVLKRFTAGVLQHVIFGVLVCIVGLIAQPDMASAETVCFKTNTELDFINKSDMQNSRAKLENTNYFGPGGAVAPEALDFEAIASITEANLAAEGCDIFIGGGFEGSLTATEGTQLVNWATNPVRDAVVIGGCDRTSNPTCTSFGRSLTSIANGGVTLTTNLAYNPATCGGAGGVNTFGGASTTVGTLAGDLVLATHNVGGSAAVTTDSLLDPTFVFTADADMFGSSGSNAIGSGPTATSDQAIFLLNIFKFSLDGLAQRLGNPQCFDSYNRVTDLALSMSATPTGLAVGSTTIVILTVDNQSLEETQDITVSAPIPGIFTLTGQSGDGAYNAGTGVWDVGTLLSGGSATIQLTLQATATGTPQMMAEITNSNLPDSDSAPNASFGEDDLNDGIADDDERSVSFAVPLRDFGDAPGFPDTPEHGAADHIPDGLTFLGTAPTGESETQTANGDASDDANDDGVTFPTSGGINILRFDQTNTLTVNASTTGFLNAWIDLNQDGDFNDANEQFADDQSVTAGNTSLFLNFPNTTPMGATYLRFRFSTQAGLGPTGSAADGEVEDYQAFIAADLPVGSCTNALGNPGFDTPTTGSYGIFAENSVPYWATRALNPNQSTFSNRNSIELWDDNFNSVPAYEASTGSLQFAELNAYVAGGLYQDFLVPSGEKLGWRFAHRGRSGDDTIRVLLGPPGAEVEVARLTTGTADWNVYSGAYTVPAGQPVTRFMLEAVSTAGSISAGNFIDAVEFRGACDFGDAPDSYQTSLASGGPYHYAGSEMRLGAVTGDSESDATPNTAADGDDSDQTNDDEDGVTFPAFAQGTNVTLTVNVVGNGFLQGWIDWNGNGVFDGIEQIAADVQDADGDGVILLPVSIPADATSVPTYARFRWSSAFNVGIGGQVDDGEVEDYQVTIGGGSTISGQVIVDNGAGGTTAHDAVLAGTETGTNQASLSIFDAGTDTLIALVPLNADGTWTATIPAGFSGNLRLETVPVPGFRTISEDGGTLPPFTNTDTTDGTLTFAYTAGASHTGVVIGLIEDPSLTENQSAAVSPGQIVQMPHVYTATTAGSVSFALLDQVANPAGAFTSAIYEDTNCDGVADQIMAASRNVSVGDQVCLIVRTQASSGVGPGSSYTYGIAATTLYTGTAVTYTSRNDDRLGAGGSEELVLRKLVTNVTKATAEGTTNVGDIGDVLRYRIVMSNPSAAVADNVEVFDQTPIYTSLNAPVATSVTVAAGVTCSLVMPSGAANALGYAGPLKWTCPGAFPAGGTGSVSFDVRIVP